MDAPMPPRKGLFQRKGAAPMAGSGASGKPSLVIAIGHGEPHPEGSTQDNAKGPKDGGQGMANDPIQCPNCGCTFKPETGEIMDQGSGDGDQDSSMAGSPGADGTDLGAKLKAMMGGGGASAPPMGGQ